jgi:hypothetical protein
LVFPLRTNVTTTNTKFILINSQQSGIAIMSDSGEIEVEAVGDYHVLPKEVTQEIGGIKLFNKWSVELR